MNCLYTTQGELQCNSGSKKPVVEHFIRSGTREHLYPYPVTERYINTIPNELTVNESNIDAIKKAIGKLPKGCTATAEDDKITVNCSLQKDPYKQ